jgi:colanic acid/amylovoran biosynthesis glycosyltransferase
VEVGAPVTTETLTTSTRRAAVETPGGAGDVPVRGRVAHVMHRFGLPSETFVRDVVDDLAARGWQAWLAALAIDDPRRLTVPGDRVLPVSCASVRWRDRLANRVPPARTRERRAVSRRYLRALTGAPVDLVHAHFGWAGADAVLAARRLRLPLLVSFHGTDLTVYPATEPWRRRYPAMLAHADRVTVVSDFLAGLVRDAGRDGPVDVVPTGIRLERFPFRGPRAATGGPRLLFVGRLHEGKGADLAVRALARVRREIPGATLTVVGDGPERERVSALVAGAGLEDAVALRGALPHDAVARELARADVLVAPSRTLADGQAEGLPVVPREALAAGLEIVATRVGGMAEAFPPERRSELVAEGDADALAERLLALHAARGSWEQRARRGREWVAKAFNADAVADRLDRTYTDLGDRA